MQLCLSKSSFTETGSRFLCIKETIKTMKQHPTEWEKISANHLSDKGLRARILKLLELTNKKTTQF